VGIKDLIRKKKFFIFDGDGTLYLWNKPINDAANFIRSIRKLGLDFVILSNNDSKSKYERIKELEKILNIKIGIDELLIPTDQVKIFLKKRGIIRFDGLITESSKEDLLSSGFKFDTEKPEIIIIGFDTELNYEKILRVIKHINNGVDFVLTHIDPLCPFIDNQQIPDAGLIEKLIEKSTGKRPIKKFGKPYTDFPKIALEVHGKNINESIIVGDRINTDIRMANKLKMDSILISQKINKLSAYRPTYSVKSLSDLYKIFTSSHLKSL